MKEADIFESWINTLAEGTWNLPKTAEQVNKLKELLAKDLIVGPDGTNATEQLRPIVGDDILFDLIEELAGKDADANAWNDTDVMDRLRELGIDTSPQEPAGVEPDGTEPGIQPEQPVAPTQDMPQQSAMAPVSEADDTSTFESLNAIRKAAGLPVVEGVLTDSTGHTLDHILKRFSREVKDFKDGGEMHDDLYHALYDYYFEDMPYDAKKNQNGQDSYEWLSDRLVDELGINEGAAVDAYMAGKSPALAHFADQLDKSHEVKEGSCNATMEGEYCPEHGLMECGGMYEMGTVAGSMAPVMGEEQLDEFDIDALNQMASHPMAGTLAAAGGAAIGATVGKGIEKTINYFQKKKQDKAYDNLKQQPKVAEGGNDDPMTSNSAITGAYYESKSDDALLARIKSLALIK